MSDSLCGNMRGPWVKTILLLLLLTSLTGTVFCTDNDDTKTVETTLETDNDVSSTAQPSSTESLPPEPGEGTTSETKSDEADQEEGSGRENETTEVTGDEIACSGDGDGNCTEMSTDTPGEDDGSNLTIIIIVAAVAVVLLGVIVGGILFYRQRNKKMINKELNKEDPYLDESSTEKVPMPMFEEDVPSVQELEMDELDQWMKKDNSSSAG